MVAAAGIDLRRRRRPTGAETCDAGDSNSDERARRLPVELPASPHCGDGVVDSSETCDDGNTTDGDGCNALCSDGSDGGDCGCLVAPRRGVPGGSSLLLLGLTGLVLFAPRWLRRRRRKHSSRRSDRNRGRAHM